MAGHAYARASAAITHCYARLRQVGSARRFDYDEALAQCARLRQLAFEIGDAATANLAGLARGRLASLQARAERSADAEAAALLDALDGARGKGDSAVLAPVLLET